MDQRRRDRSATPRSTRSCRPSVCRWTVQEKSPPQRTGAGDSVDPVQYLLRHGYLQVTSYQPDSRFWTFQWIEFGWLIALTLLTLGATLWLLRRRPA